jgi:hypothetical protein
VIRSGYMYLSPEGFVTNERAAGREGNTNMSALTLWLLGKRD